MSRILTDFSDLELPLINKRLLHSSLSTLSQTPTLPKKIRIRVEKCVPALNSITDGPFMMMETDEVRSMEQSLSELQHLSSEIEKQKMELETRIKDLVQDVEKYQKDMAKKVETYERTKAELAEAKNRITCLEMELAAEQKIPRRIEEKMEETEEKKEDFEEEDDEMDVEGQQEEEKGGHDLEMGRVETEENLELTRMMMRSEWNGTESLLTIDGTAHALTPTTLIQIIQLEKSCWRTSFTRPIDEGEWELKIRTLPHSYLNVSIGFLRHPLPQNATQRSCGTYAGAIGGHFILWKRRMWKGGKFKPGRTNKKCDQVGQTTAIRVNMRTREARLLTDCLPPFTQNDNNHPADDVLQLPNTNVTCVDFEVMSTNVGNQQIVGHDGIGVEERADRTQLLRFSGITTAFIGISFRNVSSLPGSIPSASPSFRQQMIGSSIWGSNNHLSGSTVRDMNSGGCLLCSNTTFSWCSTTSDDRPSSSPLHPSSLSSNAVFENDTYDGELGDTRLYVIADTTITHCTFQNMNYTTGNQYDGGSAVILSLPTTYLTVHNCSFNNCSVPSTKENLSIYGGCILVRGSFNNYLRSSLSVSMCSFEDWYPGNTTNRYQFGGGVGTLYTSTSPSIIDSNFTLSGAKKPKYNGGFISFASLKDPSSPLTISNCRLEGDQKSEGNCLSISGCAFGSGGLSVSDTEIVNTNSVFKISAVSGVTPVVVSRCNLVNGSLLVKYGTVTPHDPLLVVDCILNHFGISSTTYSSDLCFIGTIFHALAVPFPVQLLSVAGHCFVVLQSCLFDGCETSRVGLITCSQSTSLTMDSCTVKECKTTGSTSSPFHLTDTAFQAYSCTFTNLTGMTSNLFRIETNGSILLEDCRFDLEPSNQTDLRFVTASPSLFNTSSVVSCTSNRAIRMTTDDKTFTDCPLFKVVQTPNTKTEIKMDADSDPDGALRQTIQSFVVGSSTILTLSEGSFTEPSLLSIQTDLEIVGNGTESVHVTLDESPRPHTTLLTSELEVMVGANLTLRSMTLIPSSSSSPLVAMNEDGFLSVKTVVVCAQQDRMKELFCVPAGTANFFHSRFSSITGSSALILVAGTGSLVLSDTFFLTISRTLTIAVNGSVQSGSCVEANTSGSISIHFCKFGGCSSNGRAGVIDVVSNDTTSRLEMKGCQFDENVAGSELNEEEKGDDVVLKGFSNDQLTLNYTAIESFSSLPFLIDNFHPRVPAPHTLHFSTEGLNMTLAWSAPNRLCESRLSELTLQFLLGSRLHNNVHTTIIPAFMYNETMTPFSLKNASVSVTLKSGSLNLTQLTNEVFCCILAATLSLDSLRLSFSELKNTAFSVDQDSSLSLSSVVVTFANTTLTHHFIDSIGRSTLFKSVTIETDLTLNSISFVRHVRSTNDGTFSWECITLKSVNLTTQPFLRLEGMNTLQIQQDKSTPIKSINSLCDGSFLFAKTSDVTLSSLNVSSCSAQRGGLVFCTSCNVTVKESQFSSCSAQHGGVIFLELENANQHSLNFGSGNSLFTNCMATATDENGVEVGRGGAIFVKGTTTAETPISLTTAYFEKNSAAFGNDVFVEESVLGDKGPDRLKGSKGASWSGWPHLEVEGITKEANEVEWNRIATFIDFPRIFISDMGTDNDTCRFSYRSCKTIEYAFQYLKIYYPNGTACPRSAYLSSNYIFEPMYLEEANIFLEASKVELKSTVPEGSSMFTIGKDTRLTMQYFKFQLKSNHTLVSVTSSESWLELSRCEVVFQQGTYSQSLISSVGNRLSLSSCYFNDGSSSPQVSFSVPLISFSPMPSHEGGLGSAPFSITGSYFRNLTLLNSSIIVVETSGDVTFQNITLRQIQSDLVTGQYVSVKGQHFKQQIIPENWAHSDNMYDLEFYLGEDTSLAENHKYSRSSQLWIIRVRVCNTRLSFGIGLSQLSRSDHSLDGFLARKKDDSDWNTNTFANGENTRADPIFVIESGSLTLNSCSLSSFTLGSSPRISHVSGSLSLTSCEFSSIDRLSGKGSILSTAMTSGMGLTIDGVKLSSMSCSSESPAVLLNFSSFTPPAPFPSFSLTNLRFEGTDEQLAMAYFVEIIGRNISNFISEADERFSGSYSSESNQNHLWTFDEAFDLSISLMFYLLPQEGPVGVERGGYDMNRCGYSNVWCSSVDRAVLRTTDRLLSEIVILGTSDLSLPMTLTNNISITKGEEGEILHVSSCGCLTTTPHHSLLVEELSITLSPIQTAEAVIIVPFSSSATLNTIVARSTGASDGTLIRVTGGKTTLTDLVIRLEMKENTNVIEVLGGKVNVDTVRVENGIPLNSSIVCMKTGMLSVSGVSIIDVSSIAGCLVDASGTSARVKDIAFSHISFSSAAFVFTSLDSCSLSNVSITDFSSAALIEATNVTSLDFETSRFSGHAKSTPKHNTDLSEMFEMKHLPQGAVSMVGGEMTLTGCIFHDNTPSNTDFPSLRRNLFCSDGKVLIETIGGGDGLSSPHHWISTNNCSVEKEDKLLPAPFFVPTLSSTKSTSTFNRKAKMFEIVLKGETFIPCGLSLEVFEGIVLSETEFTEGKHILVELDPSKMTSWKEDTIELSLHQSSLNSLNTKHDLQCRVLFGESGKTDSFSLTGLKGTMSQGGRVVSIVIPIVCSVILILVFLIVVLVLICRRQQKKKEEKPKEMSELDEIQIELKEGELENNSTIKPILDTSNMTLLPNSFNMISNGVAQDQPQFSSFQQTFVEQVEVLKCEGEPAVTHVDASHTLYSALHVEKRSDLPKMEIRRQLVAGLERIVQYNPFSDVLTQLSSHWILFDSSGSVCLKLDQNLNETDLTEQQIANQKKMKEEDRRWSAPEQIDEEDRDQNKDEKEPQTVTYDPLKASVFRLGLVLWELETGLVPFGELDAVNASRQVKGGQLPLISNWEDTSLASLVAECLSFDPDERPSLSTLTTHFSSFTLNPSDTLPVQQQPVVSTAVIG
ncbi:hypothetical protein BLNAU_4814 [Blattamonas nauphoetae]|uniref:Protein kinase domain-containing protein n=1 Tax=Blattamonas nauphoetae TaxID=2049346 RepID=A0ABQ9Y983_9EUKA|nr:hypothetical protein BLNAU_4814 [Blattamonas nauphoetae]